MVDGNGDFDGAEWVFGLLMGSLFILSVTGFILVLVTYFKHYFF